jgi:hypothetical protein
MRWNNLIALGGVLLSGAMLYAGLEVNRRNHQGFRISEPTCVIIHKPKTGCPPGSVLQSDFFTEQDGSHLDACAFNDAFHEQCVDELRPGESVGFTFHIPMPNIPEKKTSKI